MSPLPRSSSDRIPHRPGLKPESVVRGDEPERGLGEAQHVERARDGEVSLIARVDACALQVAAAWRAGETAKLRQPEVARQRHRHQVRHHPARREDAPPRGVEAHEVAEPSHDLLLDERAHRAGVPHVHALLEPGRQGLARHGHGQRRRREVAERAGVLRVERARRDALAELLQHGLPWRGRLGSGRGAARRAVEVGARLRVGVGSERAVRRLAVEPVERLAPDRVAQLLQHRARPRIEDVDRAPARRSSRIARTRPEASSGRGASRPCRWCGVTCGARCTRGSWGSRCWEWGVTPSPWRRSWGAGCPRSR